MFLPKVDAPGWFFTSDEDVYKSANAIAVICKYFIEAFTEWNRIDL
ncbi:hypothetical protein [Nostoc sp.]